MDAQLHLFDRQVIDVHGVPITVVDDLELTDVLLDEEIPAGIPPPVIMALLSGPVLGTRLFGGRPPRSRWISMPWISIFEVGVAIKLAITGDHGSHLDRTMGTGRIIGRIPGGRTMLGKIREHSPEGGLG